MNFYKHHLGDYAQATGHLSFVEDAAYSRLLRKYYAEEKPIPGELKAAQRLVGARTREEKEAVQTVLEEFFEFDAGANVWRNKRAEEEIAEAQESQDEADERRKYEADRKRRYRERRSQLFDQLRELGIVPPFDTAMDELERMLSRGTGTGTGMGQVQGQVRGRPENGTANQTPDTRHQYQEQEHSPSSSSAGQPARPPAGLPADDDDGPVPGEQDLPSWVPRSLWREFYRHRAVIRKPMSIPGQRQVVQRLIELSEAGHDIASSLRQTMAAGLAIPVEPRNQATGPPNSQRQAGSKTINAVKTLQGLKADETLPTRMAAERNPGRLIEARDAES